MEVKLFVSFLTSVMVNPSSSMLAGVMATDAACSFLFFPNLVPVNSETIMKHNKSSYCGFISEVELQFVTTFVVFPTML